MARCSSKLILVNVTIDKMGSIILTPVNRSFQVAVDKFLQTWDINSRGGALLIQSEGDVEEFINGLNPKARRAVRQGWGATIKMDPYEYLMAIGYDAELAIVQTDYGTWTVQ